MCDGRRKDKSTGIIVDESVEKIFSANDYVLFGVTGWFEIAMQIIDNVKKTDMRTMSADSLAALFSRLGKTLFTEGSHYVQFIVTGVTSQNEIKSYTLRSPSFDIVEHCCPNGQPASYVCLHNISPRTQFEDILAKHLSRHTDTFDNAVLNGMKEYISETAKCDDSVNNNTFYKTVKLPLHRKKRRKTK